MDDLDHVGSANSPANLTKDLQTLAQRKLVLIAVCVQREAVNILHDEIGKSVPGRAAADKKRNVWMAESSEDLPLVAKTLKDKVGIHSAFDQLDRYRLVKLAVDTRSTIHRSHTAPADLVFKPVYTDAASDHRIWT